MSSQSPRQSASGEILGPSSRRALLRRAGLVAVGGTALSLAGAANFATAFAATGNCPDSTLDILNAALTAEQLATTFYYLGVAGPNAGNLVEVHNSANLNYFQAALWQEFRHAQIFAGLGATSLAGSHPTFYFPANTFANDSAFLGVLNALETAFIGAYLAAIGEWAGDSTNALSNTYGFTGPQLAKIAGQFLGTEAEHRALGRVTGNVNPPNNLILEAAPFECVGSLTNASGTAVGALLPFVTGSGFPQGATGPYALPDPSQVKSAASPYDNLTNPGFASP
jgi:hypothetical protein